VVAVASRGDVVGAVVGVAVGIVVAVAGAVGTAVVATVAVAAGAAVDVGTSAPQAASASEASAMKTNITGPANRRVMRLLTSVSARGNVCDGQLRARTTLAAVEPLGSLATVFLTDQDPSKISIGIVEPALHVGHQSLR